jgi:MFS superfamily sulfate permease-like transporter
VASAETLLAVTATDRMHQGPRAKYDRELFAQGVGNLLCGFATALPMTGVIVRSSANIEAGARTRLSAILHGVWILLFVSLLPHWLEAVPESCLGAILVYTGYKLVNPRAAMSLWAYGKSEFFIYLTTLIMIVVTDLLTGVLVGIGLSALKLLYTFSHLRIDIRHDRTNNRCNMKLAGAVTFLRLPKLADAIENLPPNCELNVDVSRVDYIDHACLDLLMNWQQQHEDQGGKLVIDWGQLHAKFFNGPGRSLTQSGPVSPQDVEKLKALQH